MVTFLVRSLPMIVTQSLMLTSSQVAGHETTSGTLSFLMYHFTNNPDKMHKAQAEIDRVVGDGALEAKHLSQLKYLEACIRETLRFQGPISTFQLHPKNKDEVIGGKYLIPKTSVAQVILKGLHHDPKIWGDEADVFKPERMLDGGFENCLPMFGSLSVMACVRVSGGRSLNKRCSFALR
jgi:cytochrome P450 / NADPH-cytochrome P450 reductase